MARLILWNPSGTNNTEQGKIKTQFLERKLTQCKGIDFACVVETHITSELNIKSSFEDIAIKNNVIHSFAQSDDSDAGIGIIVSDGYEMVNKTELCPGRLLAVQCERKITGEICNIVGFYGCYSAKLGQNKKDLIRKFQEALISDKCNVILGDFNFVKDRLDRNAKNATLKNDKVCLETWQEIKNTFSLIDTFRATNPSARRYTWIKPDQKAKSRNDRIYLSNAKAGKVLKTSFQDTGLSDNKMVELKMSSETERGPDQWAVNVSILNGHKFKDMITNDWIEFQDYYDDSDNLLDWWNAAKAIVRSVAMFYCQHKKRY